MAGLRGDFGPLFYFVAMDLDPGVSCWSRTVFHQR